MYLSFGLSARTLYSAWAKSKRAARLKDHMMTLKVKGGKFRTMRKRREKTAQGSMPIGMVRALFGLSLFKGSNLK
jgi:hypothetical protein